jgi:hypothetical protein
MKDADIPACRQAGVSMTMLLYFKLRFNTALPFIFTFCSFLHAKNKSALRRRNGGTGRHFLPRSQAELGNVCLKNHCLECIIAKGSFANVAFPTMTVGTR